MTIRILKFGNVISLFLLVTSISFAACNSATGSESVDDSADIVSTYSAYKKASLEGNGEQVISLVDANTITYYNGIMELVRTADKEKLETLGLMDKLTVIQTRVMYDKESLLAWKGKDLLLQGINNKTFDEASLTATELGDVTVDGETASAEIVVAGNATGVSVGFTKEDGVWKVNLVKLIKNERIEQEFKKTIEESGMSENELLFFAIEMASGKTVTEDVWEPLVE